MSCAMGVSLAARSRFGYWAFRLFDPAMHNRAVHRLRLEADLRTALNRNQFRVLYQPMLRISPRELIGFEALLRWHTEHTVEMFTQMKRMGVVTAIDDFGNSDFSLASLRRFGCELLKIDRALITNMQADRTSHDVVELILAMACMLNCEVIAEGVEKAAQLDEPLAPWAATRPRDTFSPLHSTLKPPSNTYERHELFPPYLPESSTSA
jgi:sensor c-di-GMP phosphodiesterase-like protein